MVKTLDWKSMRDMMARVLEERTGQDVQAWNRRIQRTNPRDEEDLRAWLAKEGVTGYPQTLLVMERFGYPHFLLASADELVEGQYRDRPHLRPIYDAIVGAAAMVGDVTIQVRKTYVSLVSPRRTFARIQATTRDRVDVGLRLEGQAPTGRLRPSRIHETMKVQLSFTSPDEVDAEALEWLQRAYGESA